MKRLAGMSTSTNDGTIPKRSTKHQKGHPAVAFSALGRREKIRRPELTHEQPEPSRLRSKHPSEVLAYKTERRSGIRSELAAIFGIASRLVEFGTNIGYLLPPFSA